ncbi:MAG: DAHL domain-containing protein [Aliidongia sp.]
MKPTTAAIPLLLLLLTWLAFRAANENAELFDTALATVDHFAMQESALQGNVLSARAGVLRNYDPLVREANALDKSLSRLRETAAVDAQASATIDRLTESVGREEALIERVKSDNALLQNSLAYFGLFSARLSASDQTRPIAPAVGGLVSAMLNFTLDTSSDTAREVENRLDELARQPSLPTDAEADAVRGLLAHGRLLHEILPATDNLLKALHAIPQEQDREALRAAVLAQQNISRTTARWFRLALYVTSLLLVAILVRLGLRIRAQSMALHRRAAFEHVIAGISMRFVDARPQDINAVIEQALVDMAECVGADRAYFISSDPSVQSHHWHRKGISFPPDWPDRAAKLTTRFSPSAEGVVHIPYVNWLPPGAHRDACAALGIQGWACVSTPGMGDTHHILGFDAVRGPCRITRAGELSLLPMALDSIANAVRRQIMEQERARLETRLQHARRMETVGAPRQRYCA